jgi:hypothetical protein
MAHQQIQQSAQPTSRARKLSISDWLWQEEAQRGRKRAAHFRRKTEKEVAQNKACCQSSESFQKA